MMPHLKDKSSLLQPGSYYRVLPSFLSVIIALSGVITFGGENKLTSWLNFDLHYLP